MTYFPQTFIIYDENIIYLRKNNSCYKLKASSQTNVLGGKKNKITVETCESRFVVFPK